MRGLGGDVRRQFARGDLIEQLEVVVADPRRFADVLDLFAELGQQRADADLRELRGGVERGAGILARHEALHRTLGELAFAELFSEPFASGGAEQDGASNRHEPES